MSRTEKILEFLSRTEKILEFLSRNVKRSLSEGQKLKNFFREWQKLKNFFREWQKLKIFLREWQKLKNFLREWQKLKRPARGTTQILTLPRDQNQYLRDHTRSLYPPEGQPLKFFLFRVTTQGFWNKSSPKNCPKTPSFYLQRKKSMSKQNRKMFTFGFWSFSLAAVAVFFTLRVIIWFYPSFLSPVWCQILNFWFWKFHFEKFEVKFHEKFGYREKVCNPHEKTLGTSCFSVQKVNKNTRILLFLSAFLK